MAVGSVLGNLLAAWLQQDVWNNMFTWPRLAGTLLGLVLVTLLLAWLDQSGQNATVQRPASGVHSNVQIGNPLIRVLTGTNVYGNWQIGGGRIEVVERSPVAAVTGAATPEKIAQNGVISLQRQALMAQRRQLATEQERLAQQITQLQSSHQPDGGVASDSSRYAELIERQAQVAAQLSRLAALLQHSDL
jgi:hypothetical protein